MQAYKIDRINLIAYKCQKKEDCKVVGGCGRFLGD